MTQKVFDVIAQAADWMRHAILIVDRQGCICQSNAAGYALFGMGKRQLEGMPLTHFMPREAGALAQLAKTQVKFSPYSTLARLYDSEGDYIQTHMTISELDDQEGYFLVELVDVQKAIDGISQESEWTSSEASRVLLRNLAHEVKNPLGGIRGAAQLLEAELPNRELREFTDVIIAEADRLQALVERLLQPYRGQPKKQSINIHEVLEYCRQLVQVEFGPGLVFLRDYDVSVPEVVADREQLVQVFLNLFRNACQAMNDKIATQTGQIRLITRVQRQCVIMRKRYRLALEVHVIDNGCGIPENLIESVFYPLVTGRETGTGLGLALVQRIIEQHQGSINVTSRPGQTDFEILLPLTLPTTGILLPQRA